MVLLAAIFDLGMFIIVLFLAFLAILTVLEIVCHHVVLPVVKKAGLSKPAVSPPRRRRTDGKS